MNLIIPVNLYLYEIPKNKQLIIFQRKYEF